MSNKDLQETWNTINSTLNNQKLLNKKIIMDIIKIKFSDKMKSILKYESIGAVFLLITLIIMVKNIQLFDSLPLQITATISLIILILMPILSLTSIYQMKNMDMSSRSCKENLIEYSKRQTRFLVIQKWSIFISPIFMLTIIPPFMKIADGEDFFAGENNHLLWYIPIAIVALMLFSKWGYGCYKRITNDAKKLLKELM